MTEKIIAVLGFLVLVAALWLAADHIDVMGGLFIAASASFCTLLVALIMMIAVNVMTNGR